MHLARISLWSLPAEPEHRGLTAHTAWESMPAEALRLCLGRLCPPRQREAPLVQRGDSMAQPCRGDCEARQMIQLGAVIGCGSTAWLSRHGTGSTV